MSAHSSPDFSTWRLPDHLDVQRFRDAQACLQCLHRHELPSEAEDQAWKWFYQTYDPLLRRWVVGGRVGVDNLEDCLQDVWTEVVKKLHVFVSDGAQRGLCSWLRAIVHAKAVDLLRYEWRHPSNRLRAEAALLSRDAGPEAEYEERNRLEAVQRVLAGLRERVSDLTYRAFHKHWVEGQPMKQGAQRGQGTLILAP